MVEESFCEQSRGWELWEAGSVDLCTINGSTKAILCRRDCTEEHICIGTAKPSLGKRKRRTIAQSHAFLEAFFMGAWVMIYVPLEKGSSLIPQTACLIRGHLEHFWFRENMLGYLLLSSGRRLDMEGKETGVRRHGQGGNKRWQPSVFVSDWRILGARRE